MGTGLLLGFFLLLLLLLSRVLGSEFTAVTADCLVLLVSIFAGLFIGVFGVIAATDRGEGPFNLYELYLERPGFSRQLTHTTGGATWPDSS